jgi:hypothetical protein
MNSPVGMGGGGAAPASAFSSPQRTQFALQRRRAALQPTVPEFVSEGEASEEEKPKAKAEAESEIEDSESEDLEVRGPRPAAVAAVAIPEADAKADVTHSLSAVKTQINDLVREVNALTVQMRDMLSTQRESTAAMASSQMRLMRSQDQVVRGLDVATETIDRYNDATERIASLEESIKTLTAMVGPDCDRAIQQAQQIAALITRNKQLTGLLKNLRVRMKELESEKQWLEGRTIDNKRARAAAIARNTSVKHMKGERKTAKDSESEEESSEEPESEEEESEEAEPPQAAASSSSSSSSSSSKPQASAAACAGPPPLKCKMCKATFGTIQEAREHFKSSEHFKMAMKAMSKKTMSESEEEDE